MTVKLCGKCHTEKPLTTEFWYPARPTAYHPKVHWQGNCRECWKTVNRANKARIKQTA